MSRAPAKRRPSSARPSKGRPARRSVKPIERRANKLAAWGFGAFVLILGAGAGYALGLPAKVGEAAGDAGFRVRSIEVQGTHNMDPRPIYAIALGQKSESLPLVDVGAIRRQLLGFGWVKDARVMRRYPDTLVVDIVERTPAALWQDGASLTQVDKDGVVLGRVPISAMPDLPLMTGAGANTHSAQLLSLLDQAPAIRAQLASANWVGQRRWDLKVASGEVIALPEGEAAARDALAKFARDDKANGYIGRGYLRFDLRQPGKMTVRLPHEIAPATAKPPAQI
ncbi:FtsQ-type POTRA domain-containing protein [Sphingomonas sp. ASV193]|uniref:cell division protein FtsQ/DivIB n=1 Tax=Sphingomonas sp. ASV193 TaxID=3144405 RepID=UPI0032E89FF5